MKNNTVRRNFLCAIVLILALLVIIPVIMLTMQTREYDKMIRAETEHASTSIRQTVSSFINGAYSLTYEMAVNPAILTMDGEILTPILVDCVSRNEYLELLYVQGTDGYQVARSSGELGYRGGRAWFLKMMETQQPYVQESYYSIATGMPVTSVFVPMYRDGEMIGIFGTDISLQYFQQLAEEFADEEAGRLSFIIDGEGVVVAHPDITLLETITNFKTQTRVVTLTDENGARLLNPDGSVVTAEEGFELSVGYRAVIDDVMAGNRGLEIIESEGAIYYASYESIPMPGNSNAWAVITLQDRDVALSSIYDLMYRVIIIITVVMVIFVTVSFMFFKSLRETMNHLETAKTEAEEANRSKSAFLSTMSHEIRTPMNAVLGITEILLQRKDLHSEVRTALEKTHSSGNMLLGIINDILDLSKIEAGKLELVIGKYEVASLINDTAQLNMMRIGSKNIEFQLEVDENLPRQLLGDELRVKQIFNNLLSNAFKYTEEGKVILSISEDGTSRKWKAAGDGNYDFASIDNQFEEEITLVIKVSDTGQGMTEDQIAVLFDEYTRFNMEANRKTEGTGLGLSITHKLIRLMDGEIDVDSRPGVGTTFTVRLKQGKPGNAVLGKQLAENLRSFRMSSTVRLNKSQIKREPMPYGSVMIVDDVETNIYVAKGLLMPYGLKIDSADSGAAIIKKLEGGAVYDIVFMDHMMPEMDGIEATKRIREMGYKHPIVALTANAVSGQAEMFLASGFDDFISKPIDMRQMNAVLNKFIRDKQSPEVIRAARQGTNAKQSGVGSNSIDPRMAEIFARDAAKALPILETVASIQSVGMLGGGTLSDDELRKYVIQVHGLKSALASIGQTELSETARELEAAGRDNDTATIFGETQGFLTGLRALLDKIASGGDSVAAAGGGDGGAVDAFDAFELSETQRVFLHERLDAIRAACDNLDSNAADKALRELKGMTWPKETGGKLAAISEHLLHSDFDEVIKVIEELI